MNICCNFMQFHSDDVHLSGALALLLPPIPQFAIFGFGCNKPDEVKTRMYVHFLAFLFSAFMVSYIFFARSVCWQDGWQVYCWYGKLLISSLNVALTCPAAAHIWLLLCFMIIFCSLFLLDFISKYFTRVNCLLIVSSPPSAYPRAEPKVSEFVFLSSPARHIFKKMIYRPMEIYVFIYEIILFLSSIRDMSVIFLLREMLIGRKFFWDVLLFWPVLSCPLVLIERRPLKLICTQLEMKRE